MTLAGRRSNRAALRVSSGWATPRLTTLLHLRRARAYSVLGDTSGFTREMTKARREFERGTHQDDLPFLGFVTDHEMTGVQGTSFLVLGNPERAAQSFRAMTMDLSPSHRRNQLYYTTRLAEATYKQGDVNEAARIGMSVLPAIGQVSSGRVSRHLAQLRSNLGRPQGSTATTREFVDAYAAAAVRP